MYEEKLDSFSCLSKSLFFAEKKWQEELGKRREEDTLIRPREAINVSLYLEFSISPLFMTAYFLKRGRSCSWLKKTLTADKILMLAIWYAYALLMLDPCSALFSLKKIVPRKSFITKRLHSRWTDQLLHPYYLCTANASGTVLCGGQTYTVTRFKEPT